MKYDLICNVADDEASVGIFFAKSAFWGQRIVICNVGADYVSVVDGGRDNRRATAFD
jgi:hypothetical protein